MVKDDFVRETLENLFRDVNSADPGRNQSAAIRVMTLEQGRLAAAFVKRAKKGSRAEKVMLSRYLAANPSERNAYVLRNLLTDSEKEVAHAAARAMLRFPPGTCDEILKKIMHKVSSSALKQVASGLADREDPDTIPVLFRLGRDDDEDVRLQAEHGLSRFRTGEVREFFTGLVQSGAVEEKVLALAYLGGEKEKKAEITRQVRPLLGHRDARVRESAVKTYLQAGGVSVLDQIRDFLADEQDEHVIHMTFITLGQFASEDVGRFLLNEALSTKNLRVRLYAREALDDYPQKVKEKLLLSRVDSPDPDTRGFIYSALGFCESARTAEVLVDRVREEKNHEALKAIIGALGMRQEHRALEDFYRVLKQGGEELARLAAVNLRRLVTTADLNDLCDRLDSFSANVRAQVLETVLDFASEGRCPSRIFRRLLTYLDDEDEVVCVNTAMILSNCDDREISDIVFNRALEVSNEAVRQICFKSFARISGGEISEVKKCWDERSQYRDSLLAALNSFDRIKLIPETAVFISRLPGHEIKRARKIAMRDNLPVFVQALSERESRDDVEKFLLKGLEENPVLIDGPTLEGLLNNLSVPGRKIIVRFLGSLLDQSNVLFSIRWIEGIQDDRLRKQFKKIISDFAENQSG